ncbi:MAG: 30S ribosomal protein S17 [Kiritimatiellae bacterium]|jgi:small subunit ribosomal protein S17|nr:30S ribosomal protein S17 [Kiritimatiellia bacterium]
MAEKSLRKTRKGTVVSKSGNKSIVVLVETRRQHPLYKKVVTYSKKFHVHDEENVAVVGDKVEIIECRPVSRLKKWRIVKVD